MISEPGADPQVTKGHVKIFTKTYNWKRLQIQVFLGWQQPRHKWRWCAPG